MKMIETQEDYKPISSNWSYQKGKDSFELCSSPSDHTDIALARVKTLLSTASFRMFFLCPNFDIPLDIPASLPPVSYLTSKPRQDWSDTATC